MTFEELEQVPDIFTPRFNALMQTAVSHGKRIAELEARIRVLEAAGAARERMSEQELRDDLTRPRVPVFIDEPEGVGV